MAVKSSKEACVHNVLVKLQSGVNVVNVKPLFNHDSKNIIIACGADIKIFSIKSGECIQSLKYHSRPIVSLQENKKNILQLFSCSDDGVVVRWDYSGRMLQVYDLKMPVINLYVPSTSKEWFVTKKFEDQYRLYSLTPKKEECSKTRMILKPVLPDENSICFGLMGKYIASIYKNNLTVYISEEKNVIRHKTGDRNLTCVACHPTDPVIATGDEHGRVIVWSNALNSSHPVRSIYHWHTLPVADLAFSAEGSHLHSGGGEAALVKWNLFSEERSILPRLGAPIKNIISSKDNNCVITTHSDNVLQVIDAQRNIIQVIQGLTRSEPLYGKLLPAGLLYNSHLKTLVMNGKPGHLQFYDIKQEKQLYNLDIAGKNFLSQERDTAIYNIDVQKAAFDDSGLWLATTEFWCNEDVDPRIWLKFWKFDFEKQTFTLNTNVYMPHNKELNCILFRPPSKQLDVLPSAVTTSQDGRFKIWTLTQSEKDDKQSWDYEYMGYYKEESAGSAAYSEDGSILAVAFGQVATLWNIEKFSLKERLFSKRKIQQLLFGCHSAFKYLLGHDGSSITAWDCLTLTVSWIVHVEVQVLARDIASGSIAAFCKDQNLKIFKPDCPQPLDCIEKVSDSPIVSALFVPCEDGNGVEGCFNESSQLFFFDGAQNLFTLSQSSEEDVNVPSQKKIVAQNLKETPFGILQAKKIVSDVKKAQSEQFVVSKELEQTNIISNPTWQDMGVLFKALVPKLLIPREKDEIKERSTDTHSVTPVEESKDESDSTFIFEEDWLTKAMRNVKPKFLDLSSLAQRVQFIEQTQT